MFINADFNADADFFLEYFVRNFPAKQSSSKV